MRLIHVQCNALNKILCLPTYHKKINTYSNYILYERNKIFCLPTNPPSKIRVGKGQTSNKPKRNLVEEKTCIQKIRNVI
jgi:hypothetical protein